MKPLTLKQFRLILLPLLLFSCSAPLEKEDELLFSEVPPAPMKADSIRTGEPIPFVSVDTIPFVNQPWYPIVPEKKTLKTDNMHRADSLHIILGPRSPIPIKPDTIQTKPFINYVSHPEPVKAGDLRGTGTARENIQYLDVEQGLASSNVNAIVEDKYGFIWFGLSNGLTRYDGNYLYNYTTENGLISNNIQELVIDSEQNMWIVTPKGIMKFDGEKFEIYTMQNGIPALPATELIEDEAGNMWFISDGVVKYDGKTFFHYSTKNGLRTNEISMLGLDASGQLFIGYYANWVDFLKNDTLRRFNEGVPIFHQIGSNINMESMVDKDGHFWLVNYNATISKFIRDSLVVRYNTSHISLPHYSLDEILQDSKGNMWFGSVEAGILKLENDSTFKSYTTVQGLNTNFVTELFEDSKGNIWVGTLGGGVNKIVPSSFRFYDQADGFSAKTSYTMHLDQHGNLMNGTWADGLYSFDGENIYKHREHLGELIIFSVDEDYFGNLVVGMHQHGTFYLSPSANDTILYDSLQNWMWIPGFRFFGIRDSQVDNDGNLWLFDDTYGIYEFKLSADKTRYETIEHFTIESGLVTGTILNSGKQKNGAIWITDGKNGASKIQNGSITHYTTQNGLPSNNVHSFYVDSKDRVWFGTLEGIAIYDGTSFTRIQKSDGLSSNSCRSMIEDRLGRFWVGTYNGLNLLEPDPSKSCGYAISSFATQDGLRSTEFIANCTVLDSANALWWGTRNGIIKLDLNQFELSQGVPEVRLTSINLMNQHVNYRALEDAMESHTDFYLKDSTTLLNEVLFDSVVPYFNYPAGLVLPYNIHTITFSFSSLTGVASNQIRYRYRLVGFQHDWSQESASNEAKFSNLPAGEYTFEVQAGIHNKEWGPAASYHFVITPPFWQTWWFRILALAAFLGLLYLIIRWRNRALLERQQQLENTVKERTQEIQEQKTLIEEKQIEILDSINYAKRIQRALLASDDMMRANLSDYFVFFQPKDIVSGDFYWSTVLAGGQFVLVTADSTGHGVPGAIMSMLNISCLEKAIESERASEPKDILNFTRRKIIETLSKDGSPEGGKDGMDCSLIRFDFDQQQLCYAAANNGIWIYRNGDLMEFAPDKMPVGKHVRDSLDFTQKTVDLQKGDIIYTFTDGLPDQFGGDKGKKFKYKTLKQLLIQNASLPMQQQAQKLEEAFIYWKGDLEQVDDICVIGVRI